MKFFFRCTEQWDELQDISTFTRADDAHCVADFFSCLCIEKVNTMIKYSVKIRLQNKHVINQVEDRLRKFILPHMELQLDMRQNNVYKSMFYIFNIVIFCHSLPHGTFFCVCSDYVCWFFSKLLRLLWCSPQNASFLRSVWMLLWYNDVIISIFALIYFIET